MRVTIEAVNIQEVEQILLLLKNLNLKDIQVSPGPSGEHPMVTKGDKKIDPRELFGIWKNNPRSLEQIRESAWKRDWNN